MSLAPAEKKPLTRRPLSRGKRVLFSVMLGLLTCGLLETISTLTLFFHAGRVSTVRDNLRAQAETNSIFGTGRNIAREDNAAIPTEVVHPYVGFVRRAPPTSDGAIDYGLPGTQQPIRRREPGQILVGITGGSVAEFFAAEAGGDLTRLLEKLPAFSGKKVVLIPLGFSSYKQPQQLMLVNYLMTLGAEFDYLINLDGYNELALTATFNVPHHVFPSFPREWNLRVTRAADLETLRMIGRITYLRDAAQRWAGIFDHWPARESPTMLLIWHTVHVRLRDAANQQYAAFRDRQSQRLDYAGTGPQQKFANDRELHEHCTEIWYRSSLQMAQLARARDIKYFHFLQPNQYVPNSKQMGPGEIDAAFDRDHESRPHIAAGYPLLQAAGKRLIEQNVRFHDLSQIYARIETPIYKDTCCHVNAEGNKIMAAAIAEAIAADR